MPIKRFLEKDLKTQIKTIAALAIGTYGLLTAIYTVPTDSAAVVQRFGKYTRTTEPGIHLKLPYNIEGVTPVPVKRVLKEEFGYRTLEAGIDSRYIGINEITSGIIEEKDLIGLIKESGEEVGDNYRNRAIEILREEYLTLTGDLNMADIEWVVQYKIKDPVAYLFNIKEPTHTIRDAAMSVMKQIAGNGSVDEAITIGREAYEIQSKEMLQDILDKYDIGVHIVTVKLQSSNPPFKVRSAFNKVNEAMQQKEQRINEAKKLYNEAVPKASGEAERIIKAAEGYAAQRVKIAEGDVKKFEEIYREYKEAPEITRERMYLETMSKVLPEIDKIVIVEEDGILLKHLPLDSDKSGEVAE